MKIQKIGPAPDAPYQEMYLTLFRAVTAALGMMENGEFVKAHVLLIRAQQETEELYMEGNE